MSEITLHYSFSKQENIVTMYGEASLICIKRFADALIKYHPKRDGDYLWITKDRTYLDDYDFNW